MSVMEKIASANKLSSNSRYRGMYQKEIFSIFQLIGWPPRGCHLPLDPLKFHNAKELLEIKPRYNEHIHLTFLATDCAKKAMKNCVTYNKHMKLIQNGEKHLPVGREHIWESLTSRARNTIRKSAKHQFMISSGKLSHFYKQVHELLTITASRKKYINTLSLKMLKELSLILSEDDYLLMLAKSDEMVISFCLFLIENDKAIYYQGSTATSFVRSGVSSELMYEGLTSLSDRSVKTLDMNGLGDPGVRKWKESFNLNNIELIHYEREGIVFNLFRKIYGVIKR